MSQPGDTPLQPFEPWAVAGGSRWHPLGTYRILFFREAPPRSPCRKHRWWSPHKISGPSDLRTAHECRSRLPPPSRGHEAMPWIRQHWAAHTRQRCKLGARTQQSGAGHVLFVILVLAPHALCFLRHSISIGCERRGVTGNVATTVALRPKAEASNAREGENGRGPMRCATTVTRLRCFVHDRFT